MPPEQNTSELDHLLIQNEKHNERQESQLDVLIEQSDKVEPILEAQLVKLGDIADALNRPEKETQDIPEVADTATVIVKGLKGDKGDKGDTPTNDELVSLIKPLIPEPIKGDDGHTPTEQELVALIQPLIPDPVPGKDGKTPTQEELVSLIEPLIPAPIPGKEGPRGPRGLKGEGASFTTEELLTMLKNKLSYDDLKDLPNLAAIQALASKSIEIYDESSKLEANLESINFSGDGVTTTSDGHGNITVVITGGATPTVYTETPTGSIDGVNDTYTTAHTIQAVYSFAINGQFIHPSDYSYTGSSITLTTPLDASLSGAPFTLIYS